MKHVLPGLIILCTLLTGAHSLRFGPAWNVLPVLLPLLALKLRRPFLRLLLAGAALAALFLWTTLCADLIQARLALGEPWLRLAAILGAVTGVHLMLLLLLLGQAGTTMFGPLTRDALAAAVTSGLTAGALLLAAHKAPFPLLLGERFWPGSGPVWIALFGLYAGFVAERFLAGPDPRLRSAVWTLFSAVFFGQLLLGLAGCTTCLMTGTLHLPVPALILAGPLYRGSGLFMPVLLGISLLLVGPAWCSHLCYIGAWDDRMARQGPKRPQPLPGWSRYQRLGLTLLTPVVAVGARLCGIAWLPALTLAAIFGLIGVALMLLWSRRTGVMTHCVTWCPIGLVNNALGRLLPWRVTIAQDCTGCGACSGACRYNALTPGDLERRRPGLSCSLCGDCLPRCRHGHLAYGFPGLSARGARRLFIVLIVCLHTIFLAVARM